MDHLDDILPMVAGAKMNEENQGRALLVRALAPKIDPDRVRVLLETLGFESTRKTAGGYAANDGGLTPFAGAAYRYFAHADGGQFELPISGPRVAQLELLSYWIETLVNDGRVSLERVAARLTVPERYEF